MDLFDYLRSAKLNDFEEKFPTTAKVSDFLATGNPNNNPFYGLLGMKKKLDDAVAAKLSNTTIGTLRNGVYQLVRSDPTIAVVGNWVVGRPLFWADKATFKVTTVAADATVEYAGQAISTLATAGSFKIMQIDGEAPALLSAALTKAAPAINDPVVLKFGANLADVDVELDATGWANAIIKRWIGYLDEAAVAGQVKRIVLTQAHKAQNKGIFT